MPTQVYTYRQQYTTPATLHSTITDLYDWMLHITPIRWLTHTMMIDTTHASHSVHSEPSNEQPQFDNTLKSPRNAEPRSRSVSPLLPSTLNNTHRINSHDNLSKHRLPPAINKKLTKKLIKQRKNQWSNTEIVFTMAIVCTVLSCAVWSYRIVSEAVYTVNKLYGTT